MYTLTIIIMLLNGTQFQQQLDSSYSSIKECKEVGTKSVEIVESALKKLRKAGAVNLTDVKVSFDCKEL